MGHAPGVDDRYGFASVEVVLPDPFPPGVDPGSVTLPSVPRLGSAEDDEAHHHAHWRTHVWAALHRYRRTYADPDCPLTLRDGYAGVAEEARRLAERAGDPHPMSLIDSVACHAALKELTTGAASLESTVTALRSRPVGVQPDTTGADDSADVRDATGATGTADRGAARQSAAPPLGARGQDFFASASATPPRSFEFRLGLRGSRGLRRRRLLGGEDAGVPEAE